jgi:AAA15 family ATPase/GTPase
MRIDRLWISRFKNLQDFEIDFDENELISVVVGRNGTGKSNVLEALVIIFRDLDLGKDPQFSFRLVYQIGEFDLWVDANPERYKEDKRATKDFYHIKVKKTESQEWEELSFSRFSGDEERRYLPRYVFGYYSGPSNRLEKHFEEHQEKFRKELIDEKRKSEVPPSRPLLYARRIHSQFALLAFFLEQDENVKRFLREQLRIVGLDSVLFVLQTPSWAKTKDKRRDLFWTAKATVRTFMELLYKEALAPFKINASRTEDYLYLYIKDEQTLQSVAQAYIKQEQFKEDETSFQSFFKALESTYISDFIQDSGKEENVRIKVQIENVDGSLTFRELSEGEQQLLMVLGLMRFTKENESLFLLDEPDTHLNPAWSVDYLRFIEGAHDKNIVGLRNNSQVIMTTHNPMTLAGLSASQVKIVHRKTDGRVYYAQAKDDPKGMGFAGILTSDIFGLQSTLDPETLEKLDQQRRLLIKDETELTDEERIDLNRLNQELEDIDATRFVRDPYYPLFVKTMKRYEVETGSFQARALTVEELEEREEIAFDILNDIFDEADSE